jgi:hypothetical protein
VGWRLPRSGQRRETRIRERWRKSYLGSKIDRKLDPPNSAGIESLGKITMHGAVKTPVRTAGAEP